MTILTLEQARATADGALAYAARTGLKPLSVAVIDARGAPLALLTQDRCPPMRWRVALGKAQAALGMGVDSRALHQMAIERPHFVAALAHMAGDGFTPVPGGLLILDADGATIGAIGISGDASDNDEAAAKAGVRGAGLQTLLP
jgi:uncharacterized protein GlcG (DUF336 family)